MINLIFNFHVHEVSWVIVYLKTLASNAVDIFGNSFVTSLTGFSILIIPALKPLAAIEYMNTVNFS